MTTPTQQPVSGDWRVRVAADVAALRTSDPALLAELTAVMPQRTRAGILRFTSTPSVDPRATSVFLDRLARGGGSATERAALGEVLARTTGAYADALVDLFAGEREAMVRSAFVHSAKRATSEHAVTVIQRGLTDPAAEVQAEAARVAAGHPAGPRLAPELRAALASSAPEVRAEAARALGILGVVSARGELVALLQDGAADVRLESLRALDRIAPGSVDAATLASLSRDTDERISRLAVRLADTAVR
ncbi:MAG: HEAT repeat domain-containing protein [Deltaproteobacteria bacterium]|nr:HEAT repeat domain-containing protein [Deltaproteobacteria bacterium]MDQ3295266.1 HEAT repeat domain-containing protein [Myxococcota bacterium]